MAASIPTADDVRAIVREELARALADLRGSGPEVLTTEQAADIAQVTAKTVRAWIEAGDLPAGKRGRRRTVNRADLERFLAGDRPSGESTDRLLRGIG